MNKKFLYILTFLILIAAMSPALLSQLKLESLNKNVLCSVKINNLNLEVMSTLTDKSVENIQFVILDDSILIDPSNSQNISIIYSAGFKYGITVDLTPKSPEYFANLTDIIKKYNIHMLFFEEKNKSLNKETYEKITDIASKYDVNIGLIENSSQNGLQYNNISNYSEKLYGISNRASFINSEDIKSITTEGLKFRLLRSVVDRGIRYISVEASDIKSLYFCNKVFGNLKEELAEKGYNLSEKSVIKTSGNIPYKAIIITLFSVFQLIGFLMILNLNKRHAMVLIGVFVTLIVILYILTFESAMLLLAFSVTNTVPSIAAIYMYKYSDKIKTFNQIFICHILYFLFNIFSGCFIWLALSEFNFRIGFASYKLAAFSYILPFIAVLCFIFKAKGKSFIEVKKALHNKISFVLTLLTIIALYIYLSRSSNYSLIPATFPELKLRTLLEDLASARPRLKEFLIGYPCFFLFYLFNRSNTKVFKLYLLLGANIVSISILNTFCHSFTPVNISIIRAFSGFILGSATAAFTFFIEKFAVRSALQPWSRNSFSDSRNR